MCLTQPRNSRSAARLPGSAMPVSGVRSVLQWASARVHLPLWHEVVGLAQLVELRRHAMWRSPAVDARGLPVVLVGGLGGSPRLLAPLAGLLNRYNCRCVVAPTGFGVGCGEEAAQVVENTVAELATATGERVVIIGHSRGGQFARAAAVRRSSQVAGLITLGSPLVELLAVNAGLRVLVGLLGVGGLLGVRGLMRPSCLWGECCRRLRSDIAGPFPETITFSAIFSRADSVVSWPSCLDPAARHIEVACTHGGLLWCPRSLRAVTAELKKVVTLSQRRATGSTGVAVVL